MSERKYSVSEIDRMRRAITMSYPSGVPYYATERSAETEDRLRTYMANGTAPEELEKEAWSRISFSQGKSVESADEAKNV